MLTFGTFAFVLSLPVLCISLAIRQDDVTIQTTFKIDQACSSEQRQIIEQGQRDALELANAVFDDCSELKTTADHARCINWESQAVGEYFGPKAMNRGERQRIFDTFDKATNMKRSWFGDWWNDRYVWVFCNDPRNKCKGPAYTITNNVLYAEIVYCPLFFTNLTNHQDLVNEIKNDKSGQKRLNVRNLRSRATTVLHEWLHIKNFPTTVCEGGCSDTVQKIGPNGDESVLTYKAGRSKLLAAKDVSLAARTNDNYVYFAMSLWMQRNFGTYPPYPKMWDNRKSRKENEDKEKEEPGAPTAMLEALDVEDEEEAEEGSPPASTDNQPYATEEWPEWFRPVLDNLGEIESPQLSVPAWEPPVLQVAPNSENGHCDADSEVNINDCYDALGQLQDSMTMTPPLSGGEGWDWPGVSGNCVIQTHYTGNWKDCNATIADIYVHAQMVITGCGNPKGTVAGYIGFTPDHMHQLNQHLLRTNVHLDALAQVACLSADLSMGAMPLDPARGTAADRRAHVRKGQSGCRVVCEDIPFSLSVSSIVTMF
ncbi:hypothetical protein EJ04DRAFT_528414 [Polyplosphaeria fusca]|uniref:Lysine-specific metallo-endopeptidase domain-containing protein n=1 Tax=Polyplosphaeria fusca TaxID=682080 RepID=A0A9P4UVY6_9PLEO|nr:hypothetical protein EJ04DRAFT_528414 [Polyplosphaeria fusca]